jgi:hypothetical protein
MNSKLIQQKLKTYNIDNMSLASQALKKNTQSPYEVFNVNKTQLNHVNQSINIMKHFPPAIQE